jgi:hypothetical protein
MLYNWVILSVSGVFFDVCVQLQKMIEVLWQTVNLFFCSLRCDGWAAFIFSGDHVKSILS